MLVRRSVATTLEAIRNYVASSQAPLKEEFLAMAGELLIH
jgi:hypothetical protein